MFSTILLSSLLAFSVSSAHARALKRDIAPFPADAEVGTINVDLEAQKAAYIEALSLSETEDGGDVEANTIRLVNFDGCSNMPGISNAETQIYSGWQQAQKIMAVQSLKDGTVDFNTAGALEYLGAAGLNAPRQGDMNTIFKNFATLTPAYWPFGWRIHVRCDDPLMLCSCGESKRAYTTTYDIESKLARINFCATYFKTDTLNNALNVGKNLPNDQKFDMNRYWSTQGHIWAHELMHIDWVTGAQTPRWRYGHNQHVTDMTIQFRDTNGRVVKTSAYEPRAAKILARWPTNTGDYTIRNADNLALFMTSQYVQEQLGNQYPQYPLVTIPGPDRAPYTSLFILEEDGSVTLNATSPDYELFVTPDVDGSCPSNEDEPEPEPVDFTSLPPASDDAYPSEYVDSLNAWTEEVNPADDAGPEEPPPEEESEPEEPPPEDSEPEEPPPEEEEEEEDPVIVCDVFECTNVDPPE